MVHRQIAGVMPAVLANVVITAKNLPAGQFDLQTWTVDHLLQPDDGRPWEGLFDGLDIAASIHHHVGFLGKDQANGATGITDIDGLEVSVKDQNRRVHIFTRWRVLYSRPIRGHWGIRLMEREFCQPVRQFSKNPIR